MSSSVSVDDLDALLGDLEKTCQKSPNSSSLMANEKEDQKTNNEKVSQVKDNLDELDNLLMDLSSQTKLSGAPPKSPVSTLIPNKTKETEALMREMQQESPKILEKSAKTNPEKPEDADSKWAYQGYGIWETSGDPEDSTNSQNNRINTQIQTSKAETETEVVYGNVVSSAKASTATKELDELMSSLNTFKLKGPAANGIKDEEKVEDKMEDNLDDMLGNLHQDLGKQGVKIVPRGVCAGCMKQIMGGKIITALGKTWHPEHFMCNHCNKELGTENFFERDGRSFCEEDYHKLFSPRCGLCQEAIMDKCVSAMDLTWHPECFVCFECKNGFGEDGFHEKRGRAFCKACFLALFAPKCGGCDEPITENYISSLERQWHQNCFVCNECQEPFLGGNFFEHGGLPYCETHFHALRGSLCAGCQKPISGRCITAMSKKFHPEHFVCSFCLKQLNKGTFKERKEKPYCHECHERLFG